MADCIDVIHPCWVGEGEYDHDWRFYGGDFSVGDPSVWYCRHCDAWDQDREPPSYDDDY